LGVKTKEMKREILFRGKSIEPPTEGKWIIGSLVIHGNCSYIMPEIPFTPFGIVKYRVNPETVGQFTGMIDKNGKKIFEGDVVNHTRRTSNGLESANVEVYFDAEMLEFGLKYLNELFHCQFNNEFEVIGNIHDNKELLK